MINLAVINLKDIFKNLLKLCGVGILLIFLIKGIPKINFNNIITVQFIEKCFNISLPVMEIYSNEDTQINNEVIALSNILELEMPIFTFLEENIIVERIENTVVTESEEEIDISEEVLENVTTEVITEKNLTERATNEYTTVKIKNETLG